VAAITEADIARAPNAEASAEALAPTSSQGRSAVIHCGSDASVSCLNPPGNPLRLEFLKGRSFVPSIVPSGHDQNFYLVINNYGNFGPAFAETDLGEADLETTINDLMSGQYSDPVRVVAFNTGEQWAADVSQDVAHEIRRRADLAGDDLAPSIAEFVETHAGPARQLSLRLI
jgi:hypothetical protein